MSPSKLHESYAQKMLARHDYGWAFYEPPSNRVVYPGTCGYLDDHGNWNPMIDLCGCADEFTRLGLKPPERLPDRAPSDKGIEWGPKYSDKVTGRQIDVRAGIDATTLGLPVGLSTVFQIESGTENGAILLTEPTVWREGFYHSYEFETWIKQNSEAILKVRPEVREHGLWVVRWTYSTKKCSINAWIDKSKAVTIGFATNVTPVGEIGPKGKWAESNRDGGWSHFTANGDDRKVVFMGGLYYRWRRIARTGNHLTQESPTKPAWLFRGANESTSTFVEAEGEQFELTVDHVGKLDIEAEGDEAETMF